MRHKYKTRGVVLSRISAGEANALISILTHDIGLVRARAQGVRQSGAKLASSLATFSESDLILVRGRDGWRVAGALVKEQWSRRMKRAARSRASRVAGLLLRLAAIESRDEKLFPIIQGFFNALVELPETLHDAIEILAVLRILSTLGLDDANLVGGYSDFSTPLLSEVSRNRLTYVRRINRGIEASGL